MRFANILIEKQMFMFFQPVKSSNPRLKLQAGERNRRGCFSYLELTLYYFIFNRP